MGQRVLVRSHGYNRYGYCKPALHSLTTSHINASFFDHAVSSTIHTWFMWRTQNLKILRACQPTPQWLNPICAGTVRWCGPTSFGHKVDTTKNVEHSRGLRDSDSRSTRPRGTKEWNNDWHRPNRYRNSKMVSSSRRRDHATNTTSTKTGGVWVGVELELPCGRNDGSVDGVRYFHCVQNIGWWMIAWRVNCLCETVKSLGTFVNVFPTHHTPSSARTY